jgi:hypothetical protein
MHFKYPRRFTKIIFSPSLQGFNTNRSDKVIENEQQHHIPNGNR